MPDMIRGRHGVLESNHWDREQHDEWLGQNLPQVGLADKRLARIVRLRLLSDPGFPFWDVSYCYGLLKDGSKVRVQLPEHQFSKRALKRDLLEMCKREGVYAKGLGLFDEEVISQLV